MDKTKKPLLLGGLILAVVVALAVIASAILRSNSSPYSDVSPEKVKAARERVKQNERVGPPGPGAPR